MGKRILYNNVFSARANTKFCGSTRKNVGNGLDIGKRNIQNHNSKQTTVSSTRIGEVKTATVAEGERGDRKFVQDAPEIGRVGSVLGNGHGFCFKAIVPLWISSSQILQSFLNEWSSARQTVGENDIALCSFVILCMFPHTRRTNM